jgi:cytochrome c556
MNRVRTAAAIGSLAVAMTAWAVSPAVAQDQSQDLKKLMGENFAGLQTILVSLITADYKAVPAQVKLIENHAEKLTDLVPDGLTDKQRARFFSYAYNLRTHTQDLDSIVQVLIEHDKGKKQLATDELREAAAGHYGGMVTMCVACHNRFRPNVVK